jgi:chloramphenicol-sensitive protein RarD
VSAPSSADSSAEGRRGLLALFGAFGIWGFFPLYLRPLRAIPATQVMAHRLVWCCVFVVAWLWKSGELGKVRAALTHSGTRLRLIATALLVSINWFVFVWCATNGHVVEASLGYFINPLVNVLLGVLVLRERLNRIQWLSVSLAAAAVVYLTWLAGAPPWIALTLAFSFGSYGLLRKTVAVEALVGLGAETLLLVPFGLGYLLFEHVSGRGALLSAGPLATVLLVTSGPVTALPLALFAYGARRVFYSTVGLVQYLGPTIQLLLGTLLFGEPFSVARAFGFATIWGALAVYAGEGLLRARRAAV